MMIAQITDPHVRPHGKRAYSVVESNAMLAATVEAINNLPRRPDVVIATGDLTDCGLTAEYAALRELLSPLDMPVYLVPGNHDRRAELFAAFGADGYFPDDEEFLHYVVEDNDVRLIGLDTVVPGAGHGRMCERRLRWLDDRLAEERDRPTLVFMHHPPFSTGLVAMDDINCRDGDKMAAVVAKYGHVERVVCGHHHRPIVTRWAGTIGSVAPSTAHQVTLHLAPGNEPSTFTMEPPAYQLHVWNEGAGLVSHTAYVGTYAGPHPFVLDADYPGHQVKVAETA